MSSSNFQNLDIEPKPATEFWVSDQESGFSPHIWHTMNSHDSPWRTQPPNFALKSPIFRWTYTPENHFPAIYGEFRGWIFQDSKLGTLHTLCGEKYQKTPPIVATT